MQYKVLKIEEDMDFGCEERQPGEALMSVVLMEDENGNEKKMTILFTFDSDETGCQYVVFQDPDNDEGEVFASRYDDKGQLIPIESEAEWEMVEEVINTFVEDEENAD